MDQVNEQQIQKTVVEPIVSGVQEMEVRTAESYTYAAEYLKKIKAAMNKINEELLEPLRESKRGIDKTLSKFKTSFFNPLQSAEGIVKSKISLYDDQQEKVRQEKEAALQREADRKAEAERKRLEKKAEKVKTPELKEQYEDEARDVVAPNVHVESTVPKIDGISKRQTWKGLITNKHAFVEAALKDGALMAMIEISQSGLNNIAKATAGQVNYPGVEFYKDSSIAAGVK